MIRGLLLVLGLLVLVVGVPMIVVSPALAEHFIFFPDERDPGPPPTLAGTDGRREEIRADDGTRIYGWWYPAAAGAPAVLLLHGNASDVGDRTPLARGLVARGISVLLLEYRGYGGAEGTPTIDGVIRDARAGLQRVRTLTGEGNRVVLFGRSLGGAVGMQALAAEGAPGSWLPSGVILESTFTSLEAMARSVYPVLPGFVFRRLRGVLDTRAAVERAEVPLLVVHGTDDGIVPFAMGVELHEAARDPRGWHPVRGAGHNDVFLVGGPGYFDRVAGFVDEVTGGG